jgi:serine/threonine-protein kinase
MTTSGTAVAGLQLHRRLATGALCSVYEAEDRESGRRVALKRMHREHLCDPGLVGRCLNEALMLQALHLHTDIPGLPQLFAHGLLPDGCPYMVLELLGESLAQRLARHRWPGRLEPAQAVRQAVLLGSQVAATLAGLHAHGVIHRDLRPDNILLAGQLERTYVIDLGLAKAPPRLRPKLMPISTGDEDFIGTPEYMPPEQWHAPKRVTGAADVYALGVVLYLLGQGALPFVAEKQSDLMYQHCFSAPPELPEYLPAEVAELIRQCLEKSPARRPAAAAVAARLTALLATLPPVS